MHAFKALIACTLALYLQGCGEGTKAVVTEVQKVSETSEAKVEETTITAQVSEKAEEIVKEASEAATKQISEAISKVTSEVQEDFVEPILSNVIENAVSTLASEADIQPSSETREEVQTAKKSVAKTISGAVVVVAAVATVFSAVKVMAVDKCWTGEKFGNKVKSCMDRVKSDWAQLFSKMNIFKKKVATVEATPAAITEETRPVTTGVSMIQVGQFDPIDKVAEYAKNAVNGLPLNKKLQQKFLKLINAKKAELEQQEGQATNAVQKQVNEVKAEAKEIERQLKAEALQLKGEGTKLVAGISGELEDVVKSYKGEVNETVKSVKGQVQSVLAEGQNILDEILG